MLQALVAANAAGVCASEPGGTVSGS